MEQPVMARVLEVRDEARDVRTVWLNHEMELQPGQFIMLWIPRLDEKPYAVSALASSRMAVTVRRRGPFSTRLMEMQPGDAVGVRGPYGKGFVSSPKGIIVAGGCGLAPLALLKDMMPDAVLISGARTEAELMFCDRFKDLIICTDDGSAGYHGFPTAILREHLEQTRERTVYTCGPEAMMRAVFDLCEEYGGIPCQAGLERYMKCGFGVCGQCACDEMLVCRDGPVFDSDALRQMPEFGQVMRLKDGRRVNI
ncbi:MAG: dihydroorotate dehydrogenase electron transfer subunit [Pseudomonadota bacterium]